MRPLSEIIIHCSATPEGRHVDVPTIRKWHKARGWNDIGYHLVVYLDGSIHKGRAISKVGAHARNKNTGTIGICYIGGVARDGATPKDTRTPAQKRTLTTVIEALIKKYPTIKKVSGHNQYAKKACPSFNAGAEYASLTGEKLPKALPAPSKRYAYLQRLLKSAGYDCGLADGLKGPRTAEATKLFQSDNGISPNDGEFNAATVALLRKRIEGLQPPETRKIIEDAAAADRTSTTNIAAGVGGLSTTVAAGSQVSVAVKEAQSSLDMLMSVGPWVLLILVAGGAAWWIWKERKRKQRQAQGALS